MSLPVTFANMAALNAYKAANPDPPEDGISLEDATAFATNIADFAAREEALAQADRIPSGPPTPSSSPEVDVDERDDNAAPEASPSVSSSQIQPQPLAPSANLDLATNYKEAAAYYKESYFSVVKTCEDFAMQYFLTNEDFFPNNYLELYQKYRAPTFNDWKGGQLKVDDCSLGFTFEDRNNPALATVYLQAMQNRSKLLLHFARATGSAGCASASCGALFPPDNNRRKFLAICCPKCCNVLYCSMACMARHANFHSAACTLFNGYGIAPGLDRRKRQRLDLPADPRVHHEDLTASEVPQIPLKATVLRAVPVPAAAPVVVQAANVPPPPVPPVPNTIVVQAPVDFPAEVGAFTQVPNPDQWKEEIFADKSYWTHPQVPGKYFFWQHRRSCYFVYQSSTRTRMDANFRLYTISDADDTAERADIAAAKAAKAGKGKGGKGGKGKGGKGSKGAAN